MKALQWSRDLGVAVLLGLLVSAHYSDTASNDGAGRSAGDTPSYNVTPLNTYVAGAGVGTTTPIRRTLATQLLDLRARTHQQAES